jgi:hypothetical protein
MARTRVYANDAERQRAYRERGARHIRNVTIGRASMAKPESATVYLKLTRGYLAEFGREAGELVAQLHDMYGADAAAIAARALRATRRAY